MKKKKKLKPDIKRLIYYTILIIIVVISIIFIIKIYNNINGKKKIKETEAIINNIVELEEIEDAELVNEPSNKDDLYWKFINYNLINVNLDELKQINSDTVGWIYVNNTNINYPVVKTNNNDYYLNHQFDKHYNEAGWIFMDYRNDSDINNNKNTIIYGHSLKNKALFGSLLKTVNGTWHSNIDNLVIKTVNESSSYLWQIFSIYTLEDNNDYIKTEFSSDEDYQEFLNTIYNRSKYSFNTSVNTNDKILTLSTCYTSGGKIKLVIHAKMIKKA